MKLLGRKKKPRYQKPSRKILETFPNPASGNYEVQHTCLEFTSLCPITGQPDFGQVSILYSPRDLCLETKSLKYYLFSYRNSAAFMEKVVNQIRDDLVAVLNPNRLEVVGKFNVRGGICSNIKCTL